MTTAAPTVFSDVDLHQFGVQPGATFDPPLNTVKLADVVHQLAAVRTTLKIEAAICPNDVAHNKLMKLQIAVGQIEREALAMIEISRPQQPPKTN